MKFSGTALVCILTITTAAMGQPPAGRGNAPTTPGANAASRRPIPETARGRLTNRSGARGRQFGKQQSVERLARRTERTERTERSTERGPGGRKAGVGRALPPIRRQDRVLQERLASIDRMRDAAIESADVALLERADLLERQARESHAEGMKRGHAVREDGSTVPFGKLVSEKARESGREFGQFTSEQARTLGREFGKSNADKTRLLEPLPPVTETPTLEPLPPVTETPTLEPLPSVTETPTLEPLPSVTETPTLEPLPSVTETPTLEPLPKPSP